MNRLWRTTTCTGAALVLALAAGCGGDGTDTAGDPAAAGADTGTVEDTAGNGADSGEDDSAGAAGLPDDWPDEFPDPPPGAVFEKLSGPVVQDDRVIYIVDYLAEDGDLREIFAYYLEALPAAGWEGNYDVDPTTAAVVATALFSGFGASGEVFLDANRGPVLVRIQMYLDR
jgi:hypothetical protein